MGLGVFLCYKVAVGVLSVFGTTQWKCAIRSGLELKNSHNGPSFLLLSCNVNNKTILCQPSPVLGFGEDWCSDLILQHFIWSFWDWRCSMGIRTVLL